MKSQYLCLLLVAVGLSGASVAARADELTGRVDRLLVRWDNDHSPGCALAVVRDGRLVYQKAYGLADVEQGVAIGPETAFHIASLSKHFTAFAVLLLEKEGKLSLDDDVRKYLPELPDFGGRTITLRHLLQHTSGLRDQWGLLMLAGWRIDDVITDDDVFRLVCRQRELNHEPGAEVHYCNTGFTLAARVVARVSGQAFPEFMRRRVFEPLGMAHSRFPADYREVVPRRARSYAPAGEGRYQNAPLSYGTVGATGLLTTVEDLARWDHNFYEPAVGGADVVARLQDAGRLANGMPLGYGLGLELGEYRGLKTVEHGGADAGFRCTLLRFPDERFSVILLANAGDVDPGTLARRVADIYLEEKLAPEATPKPPVNEPKEVPVDPARFDAYVGDYRVGPGLIVTIAKEEGRLTVLATGYPKGTLAASSERDFFVRGGADSGVTFAEPVKGQSPSITVHFAGQDLPAARVARPVLTAEQAGAFAGDYYSDELGAVFSVERRGDDGRLMIRYPRGLEELHPVEPDVFEAPYPISQVTFGHAKSDGHVMGFQIDAGSVQHLRFGRMELKPPQ